MASTGLLFADKLVEDEVASAGLLFAPSVGGPVEGEVASTGLLFAPSGEGPAEGAVAGAGLLFAPRVEEPCLLIAIGSLVLRISVSGGGVADRRATKNAVRGVSAALALVLGDAVIAGLEILDAETTRDAAAAHAAGAGFTEARSSRSRSPGRQAALRTSPPVPLPGSAEGRTGQSRLSGVIAAGVAAGLMQGPFTVPPAVPRAGPSWLAAGGRTELRGVYCRRSREALEAARDLPPCSAMLVGTLGEAEAFLAGRTRENPSPR